MALLFRACRLWLGGRVRFVRELRDAGFEDRGEAFAAFRKVVVDPTASEPDRARAIFRVRFRFKNLSARANRVLSLLPIPLILAQPGFRSKTWLLGQKTGEFIGHYEFATVAAAEAYWHSLPMRMMRRRAAAGSLTHEVSESEPAEADPGLCRPVRSSCSRGLISMTVPGRHAKATTSEGSDPCGGGGTRPCGVSRALRNRPFPLASDARQDHLTPYLLRRATDVLQSVARDCWFALAIAALEILDCLEVWEGLA